MTDAQFFQEIRTFLSNWRTMSLATVDEHGRAHAANIQFALDEDFALYYVSSVNSAHSKHIVLDPHMAATIYAHTDDHTQIHGIQLHGTCAEVTDPAERKHAWEVYVNRFTFIAGNANFEKHLRSESFFKVTPTWVRWIDNRREFGFKEERFLSA